MRTLFIATALVIMPLMANGQKAKTKINPTPKTALAPAKNLIVVTLDGLRWQDFFEGADSSLLFNPKYTRNVNETKEAFWAPTIEERRQKMMPFIWSELIPKGAAHGYRRYGSKVDNANPHWFSYPGYHETFTGFPDPAINSNDKNLNPHVTVLETIANTPGFEGRVAAFSSWDAFDAILNEPRAGFLVSSGFDRTNLRDSMFAFLDDFQFTSPIPLGESVRPDYLTFQFAKAYMTRYQPRVLYLALDETDDYAHRGEYDNYLQLAKNTDTWIRDLWNYVQSNPAYTNNTAIILSTDHGRGDLVKEEWKHHGEDIKDASQMWFFLYQPGMPALGVVKFDEQLHQAQLAQTIANILGIPYQPAHPTYPAVSMN